MVILIFLYFAFVPYFFLLQKQKRTPLPQPPRRAGPGPPPQKTRQHGFNMALI